MKNFFNILGKIFFIIVIATIIIVTYLFYKKFYFNDYTKAQVNGGATVFSRDSKEKTGDYDSFCIENKDYNDAVFYKKLKLEKDTGYRVTCKVKTENLSSKTEEGEIDAKEADRLEIGACISILDTVEQSDAIVDDRDWQEISLMFNSKNRDSVNLGFRLGGVNGETKGKAWFSDIKVEKVPLEDKKWNIVCFNIENIDATLNGKKYKVSMTKNDKEVIKYNLARFVKTMEDFSSNQMDITTKVIDISKPLTSLSYNEENKYYIQPNDVYDLIEEYVQKEEYDHIFVAVRMGDVTKNVEIPVNEWIGLGGMRYKNIGFSDIRLPNDMENTTMYKYDIKSDTFPEEVFVHEFLHTLERNQEEYNIEFPRLHDHDKYGYKEDGPESLKEWYKDYSKGMIKNGSYYTGLNKIVYSTQPLYKSDFRVAEEIEFNREPANFFVGIGRIIASLFTRAEKSNIGTVDTVVEVTE